MLRREEHVTELQDSTSKEQEARWWIWFGGNMSGMEDNEFTLACLELFHMEPGGIHPWHLPAPYFRHGMLVSATAGSTKVTFNALEQNPS